jgi:hypothetical protein
VAGGRRSVVRVSGEVASASGPPVLGWSQGE